MPRLTVAALGWSQSCAITHGHAPVCHGASRILLGNLHEFFFRLLVPEGMKQRDAAFESLLRWRRARNREMNRAQLFRGQILW